VFFAAAGAVSAALLTARPVRAQVPEAASAAAAQVPEAAEAAEARLNRMNVAP
jgi:hypothetical protein